MPAKKLRIEAAFYINVISSICLAVFFCQLIFFAYTKIRLHSDTLYPERLVTDLNSGLGNLEYWTLAPAMVVFDFLFYALMGFFSDEVRLKLWLTDVFQLLLIFSSLIFLYRNIKQPSQKFISTVITFVSLVFFVVCSEAVINSHLLFFSNSGGHLSLIGAGLYAIGIWLNVLIDNQVKSKYVVKLAILFCLSVVTSIFNPLFIVAFVIPASMVTMLFYCLNFVLIPKTKFIAIQVAFLGAIATMVYVKKTITNTDFYGGKLVEFSHETFFHGIGLLKSSLFFVDITKTSHAFVGVLILLSLSCCLSAFFGVSRLRIKSNQSKNDSMEKNKTKIHILLILATLSFFSCLLANVVTGNFALRYLLLPLSLIIVSSAFAFQALLRDKFLAMGTLVGVLFAGTASASFFLEFDTDEFSNKSDVKLCLERLQTKYSFEKGGGDYWTSHHSNFAFGERKMIPMRNDGTIYSSMSSVKDLVVPDSDTFFNFVVGRKYPDQRFNFTEENLNKRFPLTYTKLTCPTNSENPYLIYHYDNRDLHKFILSVSGFHSHDQGFSEKIFDMLPTMVQEFSTDAPGRVLDDIYLLRKGSYSIEVGYVVSSGDANFYMELVSIPDQKIIETFELDASRQRGIYRFRVDTGEGFPNKIGKISLVSNNPRSIIINYLRVYENEKW